MIALALKDLWIPAGLLLGFQVTLLKWRIEEENKVGSAGSIPWLTPSDYAGLAGIVTLVFGTVLLPTISLLDTRAATIAFGVGTILFVGQFVGTIAHYQMFNRRKKRTFVFLPFQELIVLIAMALALVSYVGYALIMK